MQIDWENLGFSYIKTPWRFVAKWKKWLLGTRALTEDNILHIHEGSPALHYGQQCFEGLKAYRRPDGGINLFRPDENSKRLNRSARRFAYAVRSRRDVPRCGQSSGQSKPRICTAFTVPGLLYIYGRYLIGVGENIGVAPAPEYLFIIFACRSDHISKASWPQRTFIVSDYDRAAPNGTGAAKVGGNYAASLLPGYEAHERNFFRIAFYLDPETHTKIEEVGVR